MRFWPATFLLFAGCTATQSRHVLRDEPLQPRDEQAVAGRVIDDFADAASLESWKKYVVDGSVHDPVTSLEDGALRVTSDSSAGLFWRSLKIETRAEPILSWRWRVSETFGASTPLAPEFDNFPARLLVGFDSGWDGAGPAALSFRKKVTDYTGVAPPARAICYTFGGKLNCSEAVDAAFGEGRIVVINLRSDNTPAGQWQTEVRDIDADYRAIFGQPAPPVTAMAVGSDSHRLRRKAWAEFDDITAYPPAAAEQFRRELAAPTPERRVPPLTWWIIGLSLAAAGMAGGWWIWRQRGQSHAGRAGL